MDMMEMLKFGAIAVAGGVVTAVAVMFVTGRMEATATTAARAELENLILSAQTAQASVPAPHSEPVNVAPKPNLGMPIAI